MRAAALNFGRGESCREGWEGSPYFLRGMGPGVVESTHLHGSPEHPHVNTPMEAISGSAVVTAASSSPLSRALLLGGEHGIQFLVI